LISTRAANGDGKPRPFVYDVIGATVVSLKYAAESQTGPD